ncbi:MAG: LDL receptor domain-containing protein [Deltaproteobacteria bacterium]|nr:LDL receptor domain-containing protein [Deltaproteobacteria bacterium]
MKKYILISLIIFAGCDDSSSTIPSNSAIAESLCTKQLECDPEMLEEEYPSCVEDIKEVLDINSDACSVAFNDLKNCGNSHTCEEISNGDCNAYYPEVMANCTVEVCGDTDFECNDGSCIDSEWTCDGECDCGECEDEEICDAV